MLEKKDAYTRGHSARVANFARLAGSELGLAKDELERLIDLPLFNVIVPAVLEAYKVTRNGRMRLPPPRVA